MRDPDIPPICDNSRTVGRSKIGRNKLLFGINAVALVKLMLAL